MAEEEEESELSDKQKVEIAKWFLLNSPPGEIQYVAKGYFFFFFFFRIFFFAFYLLFYNWINYRIFSADVKSILNNDDLYKEAASEAFLFYNKSHLISLPMSNRSGDVTLSLSLTHQLIFLGFPHRFFILCFNSLDFVFLSISYGT